MKCWGYVIPAPGTPDNFQNQNDMATEYWIDITVSYFPSVRSLQPINRSLHTWLTSVIEPKTKAEIQRKELVLQYRKTKNAELKTSLPVFCPGAVLNTRSSKLHNKEKIEKVTGLMQFDIDGKDNPHIKDFGELRDTIFTSEQVAFCSLSTSGNGVWGLVLVSDVADYPGHFRQMRQDFKWSYGIELDSSKGSNPTDLRFYSYDPNAKLRKEPEVYTRKLQERKPIIRGGKSFSAPENDQIPEMISKVNQLGIDIAPDYDTYVKSGFALANGYGEQGRELFHLLCQPHTEYDRQKTDKQFDNCLRANNGSITNGTLYYLLKNALPNE